MNNKVMKKSQITMLALLASLLVITPLLSSSLRPTYLYLIINILIIALGAEAGLLSAFSKPPEDQKNPQAEASTDYQPRVTTSASPPPRKSVEISASDEIPKTVSKVEKVKKCPSTPSLFFFGSGESTEPTDEELYEEDDEVVDVEGLSGQELFTKAEMFIGDFYKQLKMQREESWKRIHGFYKSF